MHEQANILVITLPQVRNKRERLPQEITMHVEMFLSEQHLRKSTTQLRETEGLRALFEDHYIEGLSIVLKTTLLEASVPC